MTAGSPGDRLRPEWAHQVVVVEVRDELAARRIETDVAGCADTAAVRPDDVDAIVVGQQRGDGHDCVVVAVDGHDELPARVALRHDRLDGPAELRTRPARRQDHADEHVLGDRHVLQPGRGRPHLLDELAGVVLGRDERRRQVACRHRLGGGSRSGVGDVTAEPIEVLRTTDEHVDLLAHLVDPTGRDRPEVEEPAEPQHRRGPRAVRRARSAFHARACAAESVPPARRHPERLSALLRAPPVTRRRVRATAPPWEFPTPAVAFQDG